MAFEAPSQSLTPSEASSVTCAEPTRQPGPTCLHPPPRYNLRTNFRGLESIATVIVGSSEQKHQAEATFKIHKKLLTRASPFFAVALDGAFAEGLDQAVTLPEEKPEIFEWFVWWLYTGSLTTPWSANCTEAQRRSGAGGQMRCASEQQRSHSYFTHDDGDLRNSAGSPKYFLLLELYSLADKLLATSLSNDVVDATARLSESTNSVPTPSDTWILYDTIRETAPMRRLVLDLFACKKTDKLLESHKDEWHPRFLRELVVKLKRTGCDSLDRHSLVAWRPGSWPGTKACRSCRDVMKPGVSGERCETCDRAFCSSCARAGRTTEGFGGGEVGPCKPWLKCMCARYHEHAEGMGGLCRRA
ncbi:hypothetical protein MBLNU459_g8243t2 [Dothideomycetes sp. NU459]